MKPLTAERIARNDSAFREANEQIGVKARELRTAAEQPVPFICECADSNCTAILQLTLPEYEEVRADSRQFLNALGHDRAEGSVDVLLRNRTYLVVRKSGLAGEIAEELDTRRNGHPGRWGSRLVSMPPMGIREKRLGLNEAIFREVNERLEGLAEHFKFGQGDPLDLVCECRKATCVERIYMSRAEYEAVRAHDTHFALYPGHAEPEIERVISSHPGYEVVAKEGPAAEVAQDLSRRS